MEQEKLQKDMIQYIMTHMDDAVCLSDMHGYLLYFNPAAKSLFSLSSAREKKQRIWEYVPLCGNERQTDRNVYQFDQVQEDFPAEACPV